MHSLAISRTLAYIHILTNITDFTDIAKKLRTCILDSILLNQPQFKNTSRETIKIELETFVKRNFLNLHHDKNF